MICPCHSGKSHEECCESLHKGESAESALQLMRSRYAAYALNLPDYIVCTTHKKNPQWAHNLALWKESISEFSKETLFQGLEILDFQEHGEEATVTFVAHLQQEGRDASFTEKSAFEKVDGHWLYKSGVLQ